MELVATIESVPDRAARDQLFEDLYMLAFPLTARFVSQMGGTLSDAKDIFQDALVIYYEKMQEDQVEHSSSPQAYLLGIAKHLWIRKYKQDQQKVQLSGLEATIVLPTEYDPTINQRKLLTLLEQSGKKCMDLLRAFYFEKQPIQMLVASFGFSTKHSATVQKYKCLEKVRTTIKEKSMGYEDFLN